MPQLLPLVDLAPIIVLRADSAGPAFALLSARLGRIPEDALAAQLLGILGMGAGSLLNDEPSVPFLECNGDVFQEYETEDNGLELRSVHALGQRTTIMCTLDQFCESSACGANPRSQRTIVVLHRDEY